MLREYQDEDPPEFIAVSPQYTILELDRETVMYKAGSRHIAFVGELYVELAALLDGTLTRYDIVALLSQRFDDASVEYAVNEVLAKGLAWLTATAAAPMHISAPAVDSSRAWTIVCMDDTSGNHEEPPRIEYDHNGILKPPGETDRPVGGPPKAFFGNPPIISRSQEPDHDVPEMDGESRIMRVDRRAVFSGSETNVRSSFANLKQDAIHPARLIGFDNAGSESPIALRPHDTGEPFKTGDFDNDREIDWTAAWSLRQRRLVFIPTGLIYRDHPDFRKSGLAAADTRGCGAGITFDEAIVQGCYDLIMRDAAALWWLNRVIRPEISADGIDDSEILSTLLHVNGHDRHIRMIDLTTDAGIPVIAAVSADSDGRRIAIGLGCDVDPAGAIFAAIEDYDMVLHGIDPTDHPWAREQLADHCYLMPKGMQTSPGPDRSEMPIGTVKSVCLKTITRMSQDVFVANLSKPGTGLQSVRILAPGLCHTAMRFAVDRLGYGPVASGWTTSPSDVTATNPVPYPFG